METKGHVRAERREHASWAGRRGDCSVMVRLACLVCGGGGTVGCSSARQGLEYAALIGWHAACAARQAA